MSIADIDILLKLRPGAEVAIYLFSDENGLQCRKSKNHTSSEKAVYNRRADLNCEGVSKSKNK